MDIHDEIQKKYKQMQLRTQEELIQKTEKIYQLLPSVKAADDEIVQLSLKAAVASIEHPGSAERLTGDLRNRIDLLKRRKISDLVAAGYPADHLTVCHNCPDCKDTGFIRVSGKPTRCSCYSNKLISYAYAISGLNRKKIASFSSFDPSLFDDFSDNEQNDRNPSPRERILFIRKSCESYIDGEFNTTGGKNLAFFGKTGTGKTFMSECIANELISRGRTVLYLSAPILFEKINSARYGLPEEKNNLKKLVDFIFNAELLIIDDLGVEVTSDNKRSDLLTIINERAVKDKKTPTKTIISTNIMIEDLSSRYDDRFSSRIIGNFYKYLFIGKDIRIS